jgi:primary-amine oxidase
MGAVIWFSLVREVEFLTKLRRGTHNVVLALQGNEWKVEKFTVLDKSLHPQITMEELEECETIVKNDQRVQAFAKEVGIEAHQIACDGWAVGFDERFPHSLRIHQGLVFARLSPHENLYAHPMVG